MNLEEKISNLIGHIEETTRCLKSLSNDLAGESYRLLLERVQREKTENKTD